MRPIAAGPGRDLRHRYYQTPWPSFSSPHLSELQKVDPSGSVLAILLAAVEEWSLQPG